MHYSTGLTKNPLFDCTTLIIAAKHSPRKRIAEPCATPCRDMRLESRRVIPERHYEVSNSQSRKCFRHCWNTRPLKKAALFLAQYILCREKPPITYCFRREPHPLCFTDSPRELFLLKASLTARSPIVEHCDSPAPFTHERQ